MAVPEFYLRIFTVTRYEIEHRTCYTYDFPIGVSAHLAHLVPKEGPLQRLENFLLRIDPHPADLSEAIDYFGNRSHFFSLHELHEQLEVTANSRLVRDEPEPPNPESGPTCSECAEEIRQRPFFNNENVGEFCYASRHVPLLGESRDFAADVLAADKPVVAAARDLMGKIYSVFTFDPEATDLSTPVEKVLQIRKGVCQDFAHVMLSCLRSHGLAARYVSGYLLTHPPEGKERLVGADASHAWVSLYVPGHGWVDLDPTNNCRVRNEHIVVAHGRDFRDVSPVRGHFVGSGLHQLDVAVTVFPKNS